jgi:hypothetical protein
VKKMAIVVVAALSFLMVSLALAPVLACPFQMFTFTAQQTPTGSSIVSQYTTPDDVWHAELLGAGTITSWNGPDASLFLGASTTSTIYAVINLNSGKGAIKFEMTWHLTGGTFEGNVVGLVEQGTGLGGTTLGSEHYELIGLHAVFTGTGDYAGWTVMFYGYKPLSTTTNFAPFSWTGMIIAR